jgi:signal transduction histidine kinase
MAKPATEPDPAPVHAPGRRPLAVVADDTDADALRRRLVRLACDVHDGPMQSLTAAGYSVHELRRWLEAGGELDVESLNLYLDRVMTQLGGAERSLRNLIGRLEQTNTEIDSLDEILDGEVDAFARRCAAHIDIDAPSSMQFDSHSQAIALRSVLGETLTNIARHSGAERVQIRIEAGTAGILLEIEDDGCGFEPTDVHADALGLAGMNERVGLLGGDFEVLSRIGGPTVVTALFRRWSATQS